MIANPTICNTVLLLCSKVYPTIRCLEILRESEDVNILKKWLSFFVVCTIFQSLYYCTSVIFTFPVEVEIVLLLFMIMSDAKGSYLLYRRLDGFSGWTRPLENIINFSKTCDSEDLIQILDVWCQKMYNKTASCKQDDIKKMVKNEHKTNQTSSDGSNTSIESLGSSVQIVDHSDVPNEIDNIFEKIDDKIEHDKIEHDKIEHDNSTNKIQENEESEDNKSKPKKRTKRVE
jgi:hypothetical protein